MTPQQRAFAIGRWAVSRAGAGEAVAVEIDAPARPVLGGLVDDGALGTAVLLLERDGAHGRIAARPRMSRGPTTITEVFEEDHKRLDEIAARMRSAAREDPVRAVVLAGLLVCGLRRHVRIEETVVFPLHVARTKYAATTERMRAEHVAVLAYADRVEREAGQLRTARDRERAATRLMDAEAGLAAVLADHNMNEEHALFPLIDHTTRAAERAQLLRSIVTF